MRIKLYLDEDAEADNLVKALRLHKIDVLTTNEAGMKGASDVEEIEFATSQNRAIYTYNVKDFLPLHYEFLQNELNHSGIILGEQTRFGIGEQLRRLLRIINETNAEEMQNELEFLSDWK